MPDRTNLYKKSLNLFCYSYIEKINKETAKIFAKLQLGGIAQVNVLNLINFLLDLGLS